MARWQKYNNNPENNKVGDCVIRAISKILNQDWQKTYIDLCLQGYMMCDMPSSNAVWSAYLKSKGFSRHIIPDTCPDCYTIIDFCNEYPVGDYLLATGSHVVAVEITKNGSFYYDTWDSGYEYPCYYWKKGE